MDNNNFSIGQRNLEKFEFYFNTLIFAILGLSIQTAEYTTYYYQTFFEIAAWCALLIASLISLSRQEYVPLLYFEVHDFQNTKTTDPSIKDTQEARIEKLQKILRKKYNIRRITFITGMLFLLVSRVLLAISEIN